jgi:hypothetical protein
MKKSLLFLFIAFSLAAGLGAQTSLSPSASLPKPDGSIGAGEYQFTTEVSGMSLGATLGTDGKLYLAVRAATTGWVALGVGGRKMDGSRLFLAFDTGAKQEFDEQIGLGHSHADGTNKVVESWAVKYADGATTLELVLPAQAAVSDGLLELLYAYSDTTSYAAHHKARGSMALKISS